MTDPNDRLLRARALLADAAKSHNRLGRAAAYLSGENDDQCEVNAVVRALAQTDEMLAALRAYEAAIKEARGYPGVFREAVALGRAAIADAESQP